MGSSGITGPTSPQIVPTPTSNSSSSSSSSSKTGATLADNFQTFLTLLTTQLKNQNPLDPLDTNQFTQQLVQFAQVEQQLKANDQLTALVSLQKSAAATQALGFVGTTVAVDGSLTQLKNSQAEWSFSVTKPSTATVSVQNSAGQTVYTGSFAVQPGKQDFAWDGRGNDGKLLPDGVYKLTVTAKDASGKSTAVSTEVEGKVDSVDLTQNPPLLWVNGQSFTVDEIKRVSKPAA